MSVGSQIFCNWEDKGGLSQGRSERGVWGGGDTPSFGRFVGKTRVKQKKMIEKRVRSVKLLKQSVN